MSAEVAQLKEQIKSLKVDIKKARGCSDEDQDDYPSKLPNYLADASKALPDPKVLLKPRRILKGHFGKIYALHWAQGETDQKQLVSASQDGKLLIWNAHTTNKLYAVPLRSSWVMTCAYAPSGRFVASGGLDNLCTVYTVPNPKDSNPSSKVHAELAQHEGYLSCARFIDDTQLISSSGDASCILWDIENKSPIRTFTDHGGDVMSVSLAPNNGNFFVSGSVDSTARLWDFRVGQTNSVKVFKGHESDINCVSFFPDANAVGTGSDDSSLRIWDLRAYKQVNKFASERILCGITSIAFSKQGKFLFAGYDDNTAAIWSTSSASMLQTLAGHENRVSCLGVSYDGKALCTGSWDTSLKVWA